MVYPVPGTSARMGLDRPRSIKGAVTGSALAAPVDSLHVKADALRGHLDALLLAVLDGEPRHGYAIIEALQERSGGSLALPTGTVYPALRRLEVRGLVKGEWSTSDNNRRARYYQLTAAGRKQLAQERVQWQRFAAAVGLILESD